MIGDGQRLSHRERAHVSVDQRSQRNATDPRAHGERQTQISDDEVRPNAIEELELFLDVTLEQARLVEALSSVDLLESPLPFDRKQGNSFQPASLQSHIVNGAAGEMHFITL